MRAWSSALIVSVILLQGFLAKDLQAEALGKLDHRVKIAAEQFMKILEQIDAMVIYLDSNLRCHSYAYVLMFHVPS